MSDVINLRRPAKQPEPKKAKPVYEDEWLLKLCAEWRACRAQMEKNWAEHDIATMWGTLPDAHINLSFAPHAQMQKIESILVSAGPPRTVESARELLGIVLAILAQRQLDPEHVFADGPVLEIVRNVHKALAELDPAVILRHAGKKRRRRAPNEKDEAGIIPPIGGISPAPAAREVRHERHASTERS